MPNPDSICLSEPQNVPAKKKRPCLRSLQLLDSREVRVDDDGDGVAESGQDENAAARTSCLKSCLCLLSLSACSQNVTYTLFRAEESLGTNQ